MANLVLEPIWTEGIRRIEIGDPVKGGDDGPQNLQAVDIGDRTEWLKEQLETIAPVVDNINGEVVPESLADKLGYLQETKAGMKEAMEDQGIEIPPEATFRDYVTFIEEMTVEGREVTNVSNAPWYNPGTGLGGITWDDPASDFDHLEITDLENPEADPVEIEPGAGRFEPPEGTHRYRIRTVFKNGTKSAGVVLPSTTYTIVYDANLVSATIPLSNPRQIVLVFDNFVSATSAAGFSINGMADTISFVDQPDNKTVRLQLANKVFAQGQSYALNYDGSGSLKTSDHEGVPPWTGYSIANYSTYAPAQFVSAEIPQDEPNSLVIIMSRAVKHIDYAKFALPSGTTSDISGLVSPTGDTASPTIHLRLDEPVDAAESAIRLSMQAGGAADDYGQAVAALSNVSVTNNSSHTAIGVNSALIPSNAPNTLQVIMEGAVKINNATSGASAPAGWSLSGADQTLGAWAISDGTITFTLSGNVVVGKAPTIAYDGSDPSFKAVSNGDTITAFSRAVTNNSTDPGGIPAGTSARNLGTIVLGHDPASAAEVTQVFEMIHNTIAGGNVANFVDGDYINGYISNGTPFSVSAGYASGGAISMTSNPDLGAHGKYMQWVIAGKNTWKGKNGNDFDHVAIHSRNVLGYSGETDADGHYMNSSNTNTGGYASCQMRQYILNNVLPALKNLGIPFDEEWMKAPARLVSKGGTATNPGTDTITDKLFLPTEYELFGAHTYSNSSAEAATNQGRLSYYADDASRIKYNKDNADRVYWEASPRTGNSAGFCHGHTSGAAASYNAAAPLAYGFAPAFCVA
jgi:hypothetical protein